MSSLVKCPDSGVGLQRLGQGMQESVLFIEAYFQCAIDRNAPLYPHFSSSISPLNPQLGALTLSRKFPAFQSPPLPPSASSPVNTTVLETSLESKTMPQLIGRVSWNIMTYNERGKSVIDKCQFSPLNC